MYIAGLLVILRLQTTGGWKSALGHTGQLRPGLRPDLRPLHEAEVSSMGRLFGGVRCVDGLPFMLAI